MLNQTLYHHKLKPIRGIIISNFYLNNLSAKPKDICLSHTIHVQYIYLHLVDFMQVSIWYMDGMGTTSTPPKEKTTLKPCIKTTFIWPKLNNISPTTPFSWKTRGISLPKSYHLGFFGRVFGRDETWPNLSWSNHVSNQTKKKSHLSCTKFKPNTPLETKGKTPEKWYTTGNLIHLPFWETCV